MITFLAGVSAAVAVGMLIWLAVSIIKAQKQVKSLKKETESIWSTIHHRCESIERLINEVERVLNQRVDENYSYTDSRFDKLENKLTNKTKK